MQLISDPQDVALLDNWQRDFPLCDRPFAHIGEQIGLPEAEVLTRLQGMKKAGRVTRVGATFAPNTVSASTLAAVAARLSRSKRSPPSSARRTGSTIPICAKTTGTCGLSPPDRTGTM